MAHAHGVLAEAGAGSILRMLHDPYITMHVTDREFNKDVRDSPK